MKATVIYGPPGTGKTTELMRIMEDHLRSGTEPQRVAFISFTKAAVEVAKKRAMDKFDLAARELPWFRTIHSLAFGALGLTRTVVMADYEEFAEESNFSISKATNEGGEIIFSDRTSDDVVVYAKSLVDATGLSVEEVARRWGMNFSLHRYDVFCSRLEAWKNERKKISFADMITKFIAEGAPLDVDVAFIDEAQDLTPRQWELARCALKRVKNIYIAGDDDQAIYKWAGADWQAMLDVRGEHRVLNKSYRIPRQLHGLALNLSARISSRRSKEWQPSDHDGILHPRVQLQSLPLQEGSWLLLARNTFSLNEVANDLRRQGLMFRFNGQPSVTPSLLRDYEAGLLPSYRAKYIERIKDVKAPIRIDLSTIHQAKGTECDNVALLSEISRSTHKCLQSPLFADDEHRVMYVGATRARKRLFLIEKPAEFTYKFAK